MKAFLAISTAVALAATSIYYLSSYHKALYNDSIGQITSSPRIPDALAQSTAVTIVNPHSHVPIHDTRYIRLSVPNILSDEEILARFVKGFFGGYVFGLERGMSRAAGKVITRFEGKLQRYKPWYTRALTRKALQDTPMSSHIWSTTQLSVDELPPLHALCFGVFRVFDSRIEFADTLSQTYSYIDFVFGSDAGFIAGVHRFSVAREEVDATGEKEADNTTNVIIEFAHSGCNLRENKPLKPDFLQTLHLWYAMLLFKEGIAEVRKAT
jgi:hypothetical protein